MIDLDFEYTDPFVCQIAPIGHLLSGLFGGTDSTYVPPAPIQPPATPQPVQQPVQQPQYKAPPPNRQPTFLGAAGAAPPVQSGQKTLLGQ